MKKYDTLKGMATGKQLKLLDDLGIEYSEITLTRQEASDLIQEHLEYMEEMQDIYEYPHIY